jgi:hypothetical protein
VAAEHVLVIVSGDPETSHRTNEAIRIALGIIAGENDVTIALLGPAAKVFSAEVEDYVDGEDTLKHIATLKKLGQTFHVERAVIPDDDNWNADGPTMIPISREDLAGLVAKSDRVLVF